MCGGAIISDFVDIKPVSRKLTAHDLWSEIDTISDLFGYDSITKDFANQFAHRLPQKTKQIRRGKFLVPGSPLEFKLCGLLLEVGIWVFCFFFTFL